ncbi:MAG: hypothetical protein ABSF83_15495, partial [Nitrososphaerales archaeon]
GFSDPRRASFLVKALDDGSDPLPRASTDSAVPLLVRSLASEAQRSPLTSVFFLQEHDVNDLK